MREMSNVVECDGPGLCSGESELRGHWADFFHNAGPKVLELGCGHGEYTLGLARALPSHNFVGVDIKGARIYRGAREALDQGLANVAFLRTRIEFLGRFFAPGEVNGLWITFPDPQPRKANKRLVGSHMLQLYRGFLAPGATIHLKTDSPFLHHYLRLLLDANGLKPDCDIDDLYAPGAAEDVPDLCTALQTYYESRWRAAGKAIRYVSFRIPEGAAPLVEPDHEPERDDYHIVGQGRVVGCRV